MKLCPVREGQSYPHGVRQNNGVISLHPTTESIMYHIVETKKSFEQASTDLDAAVKRHNFGVLHIHDIGHTLRSKGIAFDENCHVFEVCNPVQAAKVLAVDMKLNMALPCRISVYSEKGRTMIGMIKPVDMLAMLSKDSALSQIAREVEEKIMLMISEAC